MNLPPPEVCRQLLALHVLLGAPHLSDERREEFRQELIKLLAAHGLKWTDWPEFFSLQNMQSAQALPPVNSNKWKKARYPTICHLHALMGSVDKDGAGAHRKLIKKISDDTLSWSSDLPAILAVYWIFKNPPVRSAAAASSDAPPSINVFALTKMVIGDRMVMKQSAQLTVTTLIALNAHVCHRFARIPQLGAVAPTSGYGKTTLLKEVLQHLVPRPWYSSDISAAAFFRRVRDTPNITAILDQRQYQVWENDLWNLIDMSHEGGNRDRFIDGQVVNVTFFLPVFWAIRGSIHDVPPSPLSRGFQILLEEGKPKIRLMGKDDPDYYRDLIIAREEIERWAATVELDTNPELPAELDNNRLADICRPLVSIADALGYGAETRADLITICAARPPQDMGVQALIDAKTAFKELGVDRISKIDLAKAIVRYGHPYWAHWRGPNDNKQPHELTDIELGILLDRFHIYPKSIWPTGPRKPGVTSFWGYLIKQFEKDWAKHCPENGAQSAEIIAMPQPKQSS